MTSEQQKSHLTAKVNGRNIANREANRLSPVLIEALKPWADKKILKVDSSFLEAFRKTLPNLDRNDKAGLSYRIVSGGGYNVILYVRHTGSYGEHFACYTEEAVYLANIRDGVLAKINDPFTGRKTDFTVSDIEAARKVVSNARAALQDAERALVGFGEHDN